MESINITSAQYYDPDSDGSTPMIIVTIDGVEMFVPNNAPGNRHYDEIQRQVEAGTLIIQDAD